MTRPILQFRTILIIAAILVVLSFFVLTAYQFDKAAARSDCHDYSYLIELSCNTTIQNVTFLLPIPELNHTPFFMESILNMTAYGVSSEWNYTIVWQNKTPMLAITTARMVPEYTGTRSQSSPERVSSRPLSSPAMNIRLIPPYSYR
jgi:hypothetical protein